MNVKNCLASAMDAKNSPHESSPSSANVNANGHEQIVPVLHNPDTYAPSTPLDPIPSPTPNTPYSPADGEKPQWSEPSAETSPHDAGKNTMSRLRKPRKPNNANGKSALFWVHMDPQSVSEGTKEDTLKRIRSHVMSEHNRKKRLETTKRYKTKSWKHLAFQPVETTSAAGQTGPSRVNSFSTESPSSSPLKLEDNGPSDAVGFPAWSSVAGSEGHDADALVKANEAPWSFLGAGANDPFSTTHTPLTDRMLRHLQHFLCDLTQMAYPFHHRYGPKLQDHWASLVRRDPASLHACICVAASNAALTAGEFPLMQSRNQWSSGLVVDSFHHRGETIKLVNQGLSDPVKASSDELIAAVSMLLTIEIASGNPDYLKIHLAGLKQMVGLRRNFADVQPHVRFQISWTDIRVACMALTKPIFSFVRYARPSHLSITPPNKDLQIAASRLLALTEVPGVFGDAMSRTIYDLLELIWYAEWMKSCSNSSAFDGETEQYFNTEVLYVEYCLHTDRYDEYGNIKGDATIEGCVRLACLLFHNTFIWDFYPQIAPVFPKPIIALRIALQNTIPTGLFNRCQDLLVWLLFVGTYSSGILNERIFFSRELVAAMRNLNIQSWQQLRTTLIPFFYVDRCYLNPLRDLWSELHTMPIGMGN